MNNKKLKIGLILNTKRSFADWEINLVSKILESNNCIIKLIICENAENEKKKDKIQILNIFDRGLNFIIRLIEKKFTKKKLKTEENILKRKLSKIKKLKVNLIKKKYSDYFLDKDIEIIKSFKLDFILRRDFRIIRGKILRSTKYGIWSLHHGDNDYYRGIPPGFWETYFNESITGVTLQKLNNNLDGGQIIDKGYYGTKFFWKHNEDFIKTKSVELVLKNINKLFYEKKIHLKKNKKIGRYFFNPNFFNLLIYILKKYPTYILKKILSYTFFYKFFFFKWNIYILKKQNYLNLKKEYSIKFSSPLTEYWADPFVFKHNSEYYLFFEKFNLLNNKGRISCKKFNNINDKKSIDIIKSKYHYSYPHIFSFNKKIFMLPESSEKKKLELWECLKFPNRWKIKKILFNNSSIVDTNFFVDKNNNKWLFLNKSRDKYNDHNSELYIYKVLDNNFNTIIPHKKNPVIIDSRIARNAGKIFYDKHGRLIRPSQINLKEKYGFGINLSKITKLNLNEYSEKVIKSFHYKKSINYSGIHHLDINEDNIIIDKIKNF